MQIAVCDDENRCIETINVCIRNWIEKNDYRDVMIRTFSSAEELYYGIQDQCGFDLYLLDLLLPGMNGLDLSRKIREENEDAVIVFITSCDMFLEAGYEVSVYRYLRKPLDPEKLINCLDFSYEKCCLSGKSILVRAGSEKKRILMKNITFFSSGIHNVSVHTVFGEIYSISIRKGFDAFCKENCNSAFIRCHRGFVVNLQYVDSFSRAALYLHPDRTEIPVGRSYRNLTFERIRAFFL